MGKSLIENPNFEKQKQLPVGLQQIEWLQSTGTQYIVTTYCHQPNTWIDCKLSFNSIFNYNTVYGGEKSDNASDGLCFGTGSNGINADCGTKSPNPISGTAGAFSAGVVYNMKFCSQTFILGSTSYSIGGTTTATEYPDAIFTRNCGGVFTSEIGQCKYYYLKCYEGTFNDAASSTLKYCMVPCVTYAPYTGYVGSTATTVSANTFGMYDTVGKKFYINGGSGTFNFGTACSIKI